jgi:hypothetical protein
VLPNQTPQDVDPGRGVLSRHFNNRGHDLRYDGVLGAPLAWITKAMVVSELMIPEESPGFREEWRFDQVSI